MCIRDRINHVGLPRAEIKNAIKNGIREKWDQWWQRYPHARQTKYFYPRQNKKYGKEVMKFTRFQLTRYIHIVTGHNNLLYHKSNMNPDIDQTCRFCGEQKETFIHFFSDCPALWRAREEAEHGEPGGHIAFQSPTQLLNFSFHPRINAALELSEEVEDVWRAMEVVSDSSSGSESSFEEERSIALSDVELATVMDEDQSESGSVRGTQNTEYRVSQQDGRMDDPPDSDSCV